MNENTLFKLKNSPGEMIKYAITDIDGVLRAKYVSKGKMIKALENSSGIGFCDVVFGWDLEDDVYPQNTFTGWQTGFPDVEVYIDDTTLREIPWEDNMPFLLADLAEKHPVCPRSLLKKQIKKAQQLGYEPYFSQEFEWFNFVRMEGGFRPMSEGMFGYSEIRTAQHTEYCQELFTSLNAFDVEMEGLHTETGPGVYEAAIVYSKVLEAADRATLFKAAAKKISYEYGLMACFMAKWNTQYPGCSGHIHQNLLKDGQNAFADTNNKEGMSEVMKHYIAGQLKIIPEIIPMILPTVNSYKRLVEGSWAPVNMTWGIENRTTGLRAITMNPTSTRLETRIPGADTNAYLAMSACLAAGLYGIENKLPLNDDCIKGNAYDEKDAPRIPTNLKDAAERMQNSTLAKEVLGKEFVQHYVNSRLIEWRKYEQTVSDWELKRYGEII